MDAFFARQTIFDRRGEPVACELPYRASPESVAATGTVVAGAAQEAGVVGKGLLRICTEALERALDVRQPPLMA